MQRVIVKVKQCRHRVNNLFKLFNKKTMDELSSLATHSAFFENGGLIELVHEKVVPRPEKCK